MEKYYKYFPNSHLQFSFKEKLGCSHAIFALRQCAEYFISRGSSMFMAALYAKKVFDRLNHVKLFHRTNWHSKISVFIKWNNCYSSQCLLKSGVRQGGVLSPILFNIYIGSVKKIISFGWSGMSYSSYIYRMFSICRRYYRTFWFCWFFAKDAGYLLCQWHRNWYCF